MPKKFRGENSKAVEAKARKAAITEATRAKKEKDVEDASWLDDDKTLQKKQDRKAQRELKKIENLNKKKEREELYNAEMESLKSKKATEEKKTEKVTRAEIAENSDKEKNKREKETATEEPDTEHIEENINRVIGGLVAEGDMIEARSVEDAISALTVAGEVEHHPERRMKAAYSKYVDENLPRLKMENPNSRMSQLKQMLKKDWQKCPDNPMNQKFLAYNIKP